ncbi:MAG: C10 family peptidase [Bacteroidales bacterium]|nr:C10 family peptidase [Bacteroidales bacterium]
MKKITLTLLLTALVISNLTANPVDQATARKVGVGFAQSTLPATRMTDQVDLVKATDAYFVFNIGQTGFVIVSADDNFRPIVGYSNEGVFPLENPSPEMMYYLDNLSQGRQAAMRANIEPDAEVQAEWAALLNGERMAPRNDLRSGYHLVQTRWNQNYPYNKFCPRTPAGALPYAGCVATAMSQVMNYWKYPTNGYGNHSYTYGEFGEISADFSTATYDFDHMLLAVGELSPAEDSDPIAFFMYHCGVAVDMMYGTDGSGAYSEDVPEAVMKYFGYTNRCRIVYRDSYSLKGFQDVLKDQFEMGWPCYYSGSDTEGGGGHAFVCDGYDENDLFHFNWGWSGSGDGFFAIDELNVSGYAFNSGQAAITNYVPSEVFLYTAKAPELFTAEPLGDDDFSVALSWMNPTHTLDGRPLESIDQVVVMRDGEVVYSYDNPAMGEAMSFVDVAGLPISVDYSINVICNGCRGRRAFVRSVNLGPSCLWTARLNASQETGWNGGEVDVINASGFVVAKLAADRGEQEFEFDVPQGRIAFNWEAPTDSIGVGIEIFDADGQTVFAYEGPSTLMPQGRFFEMVNTCGGEGVKDTPSNLRVAIDGEDVILQWDGIVNPGYGYNIYRDDFFYTMVPGVTSFTDAGAAMGMHSYFVTAFKEEGESDPTNTVDAVEESPKAPRDIDYEIMANGKVKIIWSAPEQAEGLVGYQVFRRASGDNYRRVKNCGPETTHYTDGVKLPDGDRYCYKVVAAYEQRDYEETSPARSLRHPELHYVRVSRTHIPESLTLEPQESQLLLQWEAPVLAETYNVYCNGEQIATGLEEPTFTDTIRGDALMYQVTGVLNGVESSPSNKAVYGSYAVDENSNVQISLFPNPARDRVTVKAENLLEIAVYDVAGRQVLRRAVEGNEAVVDLTDLNQGVYFFRVNTEQGCLLQKVVLMK